MALHHSEQRHTHALTELSPPIPRMMAPCFFMGWYLWGERERGRLRHRAGPMPWPGPCRAP